MKRIVEKIPIEIVRYEGVEDAATGRFEGGVEEPSFLDELEVQIADDSAYDAATDALSPTGRVQLHLRGSRRAYFELGRYLVALSRHQTADPDPHDHLEAPRNSAGGTLHLIVHGPRDATRPAS